MLYFWNADNADFKVDAAKAIYQKKNLRNPLNPFHLRSILWVHIIFKLKKPSQLRGLINLNKINFNY